MKKRKPRKEDRTCAPPLDHYDQILNLVKVEEPCTVGQVCKLLKEPLREIDREILLMVRIKVLRRELTDEARMRELLFYAL